jgi:CO/xanthine dehydrogenase Mo-binding subunit
MDPLEFRLLNAYRDGDMKAHRREAKNCALIECAQVAAEKANWPLREEFRRMSSRQGKGAERGGVAADRTRMPAPVPPARTGQGGAQRVTYERPAATTPPATPSPGSSQPSPVAPPAGSTHGARRFSSVFGTRRR